MKAAELVEKFRYALDNRWGYIWGTAGILWTQARQKQKVDYMVNKYGTNWKKNSEAQNDNYYGAAMYGDKWIGSYVADCSGMFSWAFSKLGSYIAHGSNSIWKQYCTKQGTLTNGVRSDGQPMYPGTAVFTDKSGNKSHIGLYVGNGKVIEASGTQAGVCTSNVSAGKWKCWGELKNVAYDNQPDPPSPTRPTIKRGSKGEYVRQAQERLKALGYDLGPCGVDSDFGRATEAAVKAFQSDNGLAADGIIGEKTWAKLLGDAPTVKKYTVTIPSVTIETAKALCDKYKGAYYKEE